MQTIRISTADPRTNPEPLGHLLARALSPSFVADFPDEADCLRFCTLLYTANTRWSLDRGTVLSATLADGTLAGVLSLVPEPALEWTADLDTTYGYDLLTPWDGKLPDFEAAEEEAKAPLHAQSGPWTYINVLGVDPSYQGQGIGSALMHHAIAEADHAGLPMGLITDTERNVRFYTRLGFIVVRQPEPTAALALWTLIRQPVASSCPTISGTTSAWSV